MAEETHSAGRWLATNDDLVKLTADESETLRLAFLPYIARLLTAKTEDEKEKIVKQVTSETSNRAVQSLLEHLHTRYFMARSVKFDAFSKSMIPNLRKAAEGELIGTSGMVSLLTRMKC